MIITYKMLPVTSGPSGSLVTTSIETGKKHPSARGSPSDDTCGCLLTLAARGHLLLECFARRPPNAAGECNAPTTIATWPRKRETMALHIVLISNDLKPLRNILVLVHSVQQFLAWEYVTSLQSDTFLPAADDWTGRAGRTNNNYSTVARRVEVGVSIAERTWHIRNYKWRLTSGALTRAGSIR